jgi:hypothetical protein
MGIETESQIKKIMTGIEIGIERSIGMIKIELEIETVTERSISLRRLMIRVSGHFIYCLSVNTIE